jgi:hypothetical protein
MKFSRRFQSGKCFFFLLFINGKNDFNNEVIVPHKVLTGTLTESPVVDMVARSINCLSASRLFFLNIITAIGKGTAKHRYIAGLNPSLLIAVCSIVKFRPFESMM